MATYGGPERRPAPRFNVRAPVEYRADSLRGSGMIWNISLSGARIERASIALLKGSPVWIRPSFYPGSSLVEITSEVVRETDTGFAVQFVDLGARERELLRLALPAGGVGPVEE